METETVMPGQSSAPRFALDPASLRVLGALMEKEMTTPDAYPLSLNSLLAAANQRSSREPVMDLSDEQVRGALHSLEVASLVIPARSDGRVARFEHRIRTVLNLRRDETAVLCLLLLRGPQTPGELRSRSDRLFAFDDLSQVQTTLDRMSSREVAIVLAMSRAPGAREVRYRHLLGDSESEPVPTVAAAREPAVAASVAVNEDLLRLREAVEALEHRVRALELKLES